MTPLLDQAIARVSQTYRSRFGSPAQWVVAAPGRVNLIGEHVDYNDGFVLPMAIDRYCVVAGGEAEGNAATVCSADFGEVVLPLDDLRPRSGDEAWSNYVAGVLAVGAQRGIELPPFQAAIESDVPLGGGLSSSAALEVATATLLEAMTGIDLPPVEKALLCQQAEHEYAGVPCGIMDQFASVMCQADHLMLLDCRSQQIEQIPLTDDKVSLLVINSQVKHELAGGEYAQRRSQCEAAAKVLGVASLRDASQDQLQAHQRQLTPVQFQRARHVLGEIERTLGAVHALQASRWSEVGRLMVASHASLRDDFQVSCPELDLLVELALGLGEGAGVIGSRMTGGGFGGCTISLVHSDAAAEVSENICTAYRNQTGITPIRFTTRPAQGARVVWGG